MIDEHEHIDDSFLKDLKTSGGFTAPDGYFEGLSKRIIQRVEMLKEGEPELHIKNNEGGFTVPDQYFKELEQNIVQKTAPKARIIPLYQTRFFQVSASIAAVFLVVSMLFIYQRNGSSISYYENAWQKVSDEELIKHIENADINSDLIKEVIYVDEPKNVKSDNKAIEQYLLDETDEHTVREAL